MLQQQALLACDICLNCILCILSDDNLQLQTCFIVYSIVKCATDEVVEEIQSEACRATCFCLLAKQHNASPTCMMLHIWHQADYDAW